MWHDVVGRLDPAQFTSFLLDVRGCGSSDRPRVGHHLEGYASDVYAALDGMSQPVLLVGHSMGGKLAQYVAADRPSTIERMILVAPGTASAGKASEQHRELTLQAFGYRERIERFQRAAMRRPIEAPVMERIVEDALFASFDHWIGWYDHGRLADFSERLRSISVPVLAVAGGADPLVSASRIKHEVVDAIDGALFVMLRDAGHNLPIEAPEDIAEAVRRFGG
jgi:pimeloyl-ACP methyl ester carboxylesterase